jgi:pyruvate ferredoxin oxidoreductase alpha subunit
MVNLDGFVNTHTYELVDIPSQKEVDEFLPEFVSKNAIDFSNPKSYCMSASTEWNMEFRYQQHESMMNAEKVIEDVSREFSEKFGRYHGGMVEEYRCEDAEAVLVTTGSVTGTARLVVDHMRENGAKVGLVKLRFYRPFPREYFKKLKSRVKAVGIIDRNLSFGYEGAVGSEVKAAMYDSCKSPKAIDFIAGIAGRDIKKEDIELMYNKLLNLSNGKAEEELQFIGLRW